MSLIVGDVGGSNCRLATYHNGEIENIMVLPTAQSGGLAQAISTYTQTFDSQFEAGCVAVAGPVHHNAAQLTNVDWYGSGADFPCRGRIVNDLEAAAFGVQALNADSTLVLHDAPDSEGPQAVIGIGTGHGLAWLFDSKVYPTESGHAEYAPPSAALSAFAADFTAKHGRIRVEDVVSGMGIGHLLAYAISQMGGEKPAAGYPAGAFVLENAGRHPACDAVLDWFALSAGSVVGDVITRSLAKQVWLCGGVAQKWSTVLQRPQFRQGLYNKAPMVKLVEQCRVSIALHPHLGLLGAAQVAQSLCAPS